MRKEAVPRNVNIQINMRRNVRYGYGPKVRASTYTGNTRATTVAIPMWWKGTEVLATSCYPRLLLLEGCESLRVPVRLVEAARSR